MICQNGTDESEWILRRLFADGCSIGGGTCQNVLGGNVGQCLGGILKLHRMPLFRDEIDRDLTSDQFPSLDPTEAPAPMGAESTGSQF